jgi:hypothetical protein
MTRTKTTKLVAIVMAVFMAFTFFCFSVVTTVRAEDGEDETSSTSSSTSSTTSSTSSTEAEKTAPTPDIALTTYTYGAPDINVTIDFKDATPKLDFSKTTDVELLKTMTENIKVYSDKELTKQVNYTGAKFSNLKFENNKVTFTVPLNKSNLAASTTYYLFLGKALNETTEVEGTDSYFEFKTNVTTTSTRSTTRTTYRTITTRNSTVRARSANTDDPRHLPVWIGLVAVSALMLGAVYFVKERD